MALGQSSKLVKDSNKDDQPNKILSENLTLSVNQTKFYVGQLNLGKTPHEVASRMKLFIRLEIGFYR